MLYQIPALADNETVVPVDVYQGENLRYASSNLHICHFDFTASRPFHRNETMLEVYGSVSSAGVLTVRTVETGSLLKQTCWEHSLLLLE